MDVRPEIELDTARLQLHQLVRSWRLRLWLGAALRSAGPALLCLAVADLVTEQELVWSAIVSGTAFLLFYAGQASLLRKRSDDERNVAQHLNRINSEWEESGELLLASEETLTTLARMQRRRLLHAFPPALKNSLLPRKPLRDAARSFAIMAFAAALVLALPPLRPKQSNFPASPQASSPPATSTQTSPVQIEKAAIIVAPPRYTGKPRRELTQFDFEAEAGAQITWQISFNQPLHDAALIILNADTLALREMRAGIYTTSVYLQESMLYQLCATSSEGKTHVFEYHRVEVVKDLPPAIVVVHPEPRVEINTVGPKSILLEAVIADDYGILQAELVATLARGSGEGIKFRDSRMPPGNIQKESRRRWRAKMQLELHELGMIPGDELYFYLEARDQREPIAQSGRSDTYFIVWKDTARVEVAAHAGLLVNPVPEYFRSQRQIIIDTERLLQDRSQLTESEFKRRSQNLGLDQQALRMRYGQFLGEELENQIGFPEPAGEIGLQYEPGDEHKSAEVVSRPGDDNTSAGQIIDQFAHQHETEENATLFAPSIKAQLQAALAEMWEAELRLRTHRPKEALPHEYRALDRLKAVQESTRAYVQRVGFEPPPIKAEEKRLSGSLEKVTGGRWQKQVPENETLGEVRAAIVLLQNLQTGPTTKSASDAGILERAGQELARQALAHPGRHLQALGDLRALIANLENHGESHAALALSMQRTLWQLLPSAEPQPALRREAQTALGGKYFMQLGILRKK
ncbi:MAG: hypothetical protein ACREOO_01680 [bacterium]